MMVWWFKKRDEEAHNRIDQLHEAIQKSFLNIKKDIENIHKNHSEKSTSLHERLLALEQKIGQMAYSFSEEEPEEELILTKTSGLLKDLTPTQKRMFFALYEIEEEINEAVSLRSLASLLYADKKYDQIRPMLSTFLIVLEDLGLIKKSKVGRQLYISVTSRGKKIIEADSREKRKK